MLRKYFIASFMSLVLATSSAALVAPAASAAATLPKPCIDYSFSIGDRYECVRAIQQMLNGVTYYWNMPGKWYLSTDAVYGANTKSKVYDFQKWSSASPIGGLTVITGIDGTVGSKTWWRLCQVTAISIRRLGPSPYRLAMFDGYYYAGCSAIFGYPGTVWL